MDECMIGIGYNTGAGDAALRLLGYNGLESKGWRHVVIANWRVWLSIDGTWSAVDNTAD
jgi:hypothetical protein